MPYLMLEQSQQSGGVEGKWYKANVKDSRDASSVRKSLCYMDTWSESFFLAQAEELWERRCVSSIGQSTNPSIHFDIHKRLHHSSLYGSDLCQTGAGLL